MTGRLVAAWALFALLLPCAFAAVSQQVAAPAAPARLDASRSATESLSGLKHKARSVGEIRLIVTLQLPQPFLAEGRLPPQAIARQRARIARARGALLQAFASQQLSAYADYASLPMIALRADAAALDGLIRSPLVAAIEEDLPLPPTLASSGPVIGMPATWSQGYDGSGQTVVIVDTGIDAAHAFFDDASGNSRVVDEACFSNPGGNATSLCPDGSSRQTGSGAADATVAACLDNGAQLCDHGTHVAGIAAGDGAGFDGVARGADIIAIQVFTRFDIEAACGVGRAPCVLSYVSDQIAALDHVQTTLAPSHAIAAVNMSLGGGGYTVHCDSAAQKTAIDNLRSLDIATVVAAGNDSSLNAISSPACISSAVSVGSTTDGDEVSWFSNVASFMDLFAPGSAIESSIPGGGYASFNGTSMAAPQVAGAWAVLKQADPTARVDDVLAAMTGSGVMVSDLRGGGSVSRPRLQVDAALAALTAAAASRFTITPSAGAHGSIAPATAQQVNPGEVIAFTVTPDSGYVAAIGGTCAGALVGNTFTTAPADADCTVIATFTLDVHAVTPSAGAGGSISPATVQGVTHGATTSFTVTPDSGYSASVGGSCGGSLVGLDYTTDPITADCTVVASFALNRYMVTPDHGAGGSVSPLSAQQVDHGATASFTVTPDAGYNASIDGSCGGDLVGDQYITGPITDDCVFTASFVRRTYTVAPSSGSHGSISPATAQLITHGLTAHFSVTPDIGYDATIGGSCGGQLVGNSHTTNPVTADCTVIASFAPAVHTVTPGAGVGGSIAPAIAQSFVHGSTASFTVTADAGRVASVGGSCGGQLVGTQYTTDPIIADCNVTATFALETYTVAPSATAGGSLSPATAQSISHGSNLILAVSPDHGYTASVGGSCGGRLDGTLYTTDPIVADCTVDALFTPARYNVTPSADAGGSIAPATVQSVEHGRAISFSVAADANRTAEVGGSCGGHLVGDTYTTASIVADCTVTVSFPLVRHRVFPGVSGNGAIEPYSLLFISHGSTASYTVTVAAGHRAVLQPDSTCGGGIVDGVYTTSPVLADCEFYIRIEPITHQVTPNAGPGGVLSPATVQSVTDGGTAMFELVADGSHVVSSVGGSCGGVLVGSLYTTDPVVADCTVDAVFSPITYRVTASVAAGQGSVTPPVQSVESGDDARFDILPDVGWFLQSIDGDRCTLVASGAGYWQAGPIDQDCAVTVRFTRMVTTATTIVTSAPIVRYGAGVRVDATIDSSGAAAADGRVDIEASTGEHCSDAAPEPIDDDSARFDCELSFTTLGRRTLVARFSGSSQQAASASAPLALDVARFADLAIAIGPVQGDFGPAETLVYRIELRNLGPDPAPRSSVAVVGDVALQTPRWTCTPVGAASCPTTLANGAVLIEADLAPGDGLDLTLSGVLPELLPAAVQIDAEIAAETEAPHHVRDPQPSNNVASERTVPNTVFANGFERAADAAASFAPPNQVSAPNRW